MTVKQRGHPIFAGLYGTMSRQLEAGPIGAARRELVARARGEVVDLGAGLGANLPYLGSDVSRVHLVEPDPHMVKRLTRIVPSTAVIHPIPAERLPFDDAGIDTVLATLVLCTVADPVAVAAEIRRVLAPGGQLLVLEHVRAKDPGTAGWQDRLERPWGWFTAGCHPNRDTGEVLVTAGFDLGDVTAIQLPGPPIMRPWITGALKSVGGPG
jgi:ubiquinone/menaquinone biosynthesis C-methylase UbiE